MSRTLLIVSHILRNEDNSKENSQRKRFLGRYPLAFEPVSRSGERLL